MRGGAPVSVDRRFQTITSVRHGRRSLRARNSRWHSVSVIAIALVVKTVSYPELLAAVFKSIVDVTCSKY
jgi:hypothetical protein